MNGGTTVFVVDDDPSIRRALTRLIQSVGLSVESYASAQEFLQACDAERAGCLVLDIRMPQLSGLDLQQMLASHNIELPIIFITGHGDVPTSVRAMKAGALDLIQKPFQDQELLDAIQRAIARDLELRKRRAEHTSAARRAALLTPREREVFCLVVAGMMNKEIAAKLGISEKTIKVHRARVMEKMQARSVAELVVLSQAAGVSATKV
jgi:two-component system response regulator FixJ